MKVVINTCFGVFGLSDRAYERLAELGIPIVKYDRSHYNRGDKVIYDHELTPRGEDSLTDLYWKHKGTYPRYWECWSSSDRSNPLLLQVVEELGAAANGEFADLKVVEVPDGVSFEIGDYDGQEHVAETHRTWA